MNKERGRGTLPLGDQIALGVQELRSRQSHDRPLLRIDHREEASGAPYQFDTAQGRLHRRGCRSIPKSSQSALYGVWHIGPEEEKLACPHCRPAVKEERPADDALPADLLYGFLSIIGQFGGALLERGREYRTSREGRRLQANLEGLYEGFGQQEREVLDVIVSALDGIVKTVREFDDRINNGNGSNGHNGHSGASAANRRNGKRQER